MNEGTQISVESVPMKYCKDSANSHWARPGVSFVLTSPNPTRAQFAMGWILPVLDLLAVPGPGFMDGPIIKWGRPEHSNA